MHSLHGSGMDRSLTFRPESDSSYTIAQVKCLFLIACFVVMFWLAYMSS
jgi:hypothetical protein